MIRTVDIEACNEGGRAVDAVGDLTLSEGPGGISARPFAAETGTTVGPGDCATVRVRLDPQIPAGP